MTKTCDFSQVTRRQFIVGAGCIVTDGCLIINPSIPAISETASPPSGKKHVVTLDTTQNTAGAATNIITYTDETGAPATSLSVDKNDVVIWKAKTSGSKHHLSVIFSPTTPFTDNGNPVYAFHGSQADEGNGIGKNATIDPNAPATSYKYSVAVWDEATNSSYSDDPTIRVGGGGNAALADLITAGKALQRAVEADPALKAQIDPIEKNLQQIISQLSK